ncbi:spore germination protein [Paenibacillus sp. PK3_47]|uniref:spore germination protein n=1 Tax=Paenibacillus sp. PK3_47 TaxID=2072642 RepID=UPI00201DC1D2|nr:spore germination protein [Paenibacillus sp. PK3_47]
MTSSDIENRKCPTEDNTAPDQSSGAIHAKDHLSSSLADNLRKLQDEFTLCSDLVTRKCSAGGTDQAVLVFFDGMTDTNQLEQVVLRPLIEHFGRWHTEGGEREGNAHNLSGNSVETPEDVLVEALFVKKTTSLKQTVQAILKGQTAVFLRDTSYAMLINLSKMEERTPEEPTSEKAVRGPKDSFVETLQTNITLLRRRIRTPLLKTEATTLGTLTVTEIVMMYIEGKAKASLVKEVKQRLKQVKLEGIIHSGDVEEFIEDNPYSPFPQVQNTERPDVAASSLLEGKVVIIVDNTPFVLILPMTYWSGLQAADDYSERWMYATFIRWVRYSFVHISLLLPSLYVALTTFHPQVVPTPLLISIASAREGVPFPAVFEALFLEFIFEALREAGIRLPQQVGPAVSIAGALVIGQAIVEAGIVSTPLVIIVSLTGIASFAFPHYNIGTSYRMLRFPLLIVAGVLGFYGIVMFLVALSAHMVMLKPFGVPYMSPFAPLKAKGLQDVLIRAHKTKLYKQSKAASGKPEIPKPRRKSEGEGS